MKTLTIRLAKYQVESILEQELRKTHPCFGGPFKFRAITSYDEKEGQAYLDEYEIDMFENDPEVTNEA